MKQNNQLNRINYANTKHHRQLMRQNIDPQLITQIETSRQPALNYQSAFKHVYMDQLEKTLMFQQQKKLSQQTLSQAQSTRNLISPGFASPQKTYETPNKGYQPVFTDFDEQRSKKFDQLINKGCEEGSLLFRAQDQYQIKKHQQAQMTKALIKQQLFLKQQKKEKQNLEQLSIAEQIRHNTSRQMEEEQERNIQIRQERLNQRKLLQERMEDERARRERRSLFKLEGQSRHNPITNPIEYHIDNPYILQKIQRNMHG